MLDLQRRSSVLGQNSSALLGRDAASGSLFREAEKLVLQDLELDTKGYLFIKIPVGWPIEGMLMALTYLNTLMACKSLLVH